MLVQVQVPDGKLCRSLNVEGAYVICRFLQDSSCVLFGMGLWKIDSKTEMYDGTEIFKCNECLNNASS